MSNLEESGQEAIKVYPIQLTSWIESQPDLAYLVEAANNTPALYRNGSKELNIAPLKEDIISKRFSNKRARIKDFFWPSARSMRGDCFGTKNFDDTCARAANTMAGSTIWDAISTVPFVQFALVNYLKGAAFPAAVVISLLMMVISNIAGKTGANRAKGRASISTLGLTFFIGLSVVKTLLSGVGFDILVNQDGITKEYSNIVLNEQIDAKEKRLDELQTLNGPKLVNLQNSCQPLQNKLNSIDKDLQPKTFETVYVQAYGTYAQKQSLIGLTDEEIIAKYGGVSGIPGMCNKAEIQLAIDLKQADLLQEQIAGLNTKIGSSTSLSILQSEFPEIFQDKFKINTSTGEVEIRSGQEVVSQASQQFLSKLRDPEKFTQLGISLFWMIVSVLLSGMAVFFLWALSLTKEMKMSYNTSLLRDRMNLLQAYQDNLPRALQKRREHRSQEES
tara:strand:- start:1886 stop:3226 length:1341 start_codon:yes stop_codon:yes gene_type:complete